MCLAEQKMLESRTFPEPPRSRWENKPGCAGVSGLEIKWSDGVGRERSGHCGKVRQESRDIIISQEFAMPCLHFVYLHFVVK